MSYVSYKTNRKLYDKIAMMTGGNEWSCEVCTFINDATAGQCEMCATKRRSDAKQIQKDVDDIKVKDGVENKHAPENEKKNWKCGACTYESNANTISCEMCDTVNPNETKQTPNKTFYVYTLGVMEDLSMNLTPDKWINHIRKSVLDTIPLSYNNIIIKHYDPLINVMNINDINFQYTKTYIPHVEEQKRIDAFNKLDNVGTYTRKITSTFYRNTIKENDIHNPHIILDFVGITLELKQRTNKPKIKGIEKEVNVMYIGYVGATVTDNNGYNAEFLMSHKLFNVTESGDVKTYIDSLLNNNYDKTDYLHNMTIKNIHKKIIDKIKPLIGIPDIAPQDQSSRNDYFEKKDAFHSKLLNDNFRETNENIIQDIVDGIMSTTMTQIDTIIETAVKKYTSVFQQN